MTQAPDIRKFDLNELKSFFSEKGEKAFRAKQVYEWLWKKSCTDFDEMTNLSKSTREMLKREFSLPTLSIDQEQRSSDRTVKSRLKLHDGHLIEGVLIPTEDRMTACVSSQVGCSLTCKFCATGFIDRKRNLEAHEIYDQVVTIARQAEKYYQHPLTNIVYMGMGEPLLNYRGMMESINHITGEHGLNMSPKRITVSTAGIAKMIKKLGDDEVKFNLALSLHAADEEKRNQIMPINETNTLPALIEALNYFYKKTRNRITFEYILFYNFNDSLEDAQKLLKIIHQVPAKVNIIEYNPIDQAQYRNTDPETLEKFSAFLEDRGVTVNVRRSRGKDIDAACGQLANK
ncbi:MAG: 23S rRNA (adenine(2503)-C(2))-methyltransferase RlmN [Cyclobacteriaceae bacterium]|nr:23S rRNA (adenine(2503)-C(2))-methyltransferase RlmN [Cyclobacteriaceae bacterium]MCH8515204.1 23S rRNA (adenine(2503)-C(2))-methyltransferase RlmN [Cyclobacteriaceae bacterium]